MKKINVGIGDFAVGTDGCTLTAVLGSCVGVIFYDKTHKIGGLAHVYLPDSNLVVKNRITEKGNLLSETLKYADLLVPRLISEMADMGAEQKYFLAYIVGGASLFDFPNDSALNVGRKNLERVRSLLSAQKIHYLEVKVGGKSGRHVTFHVSTGDLLVRELSNPK